MLSQKGEVDEDFSLIFIIRLSISILKYKLSYGTAINTHERTDLRGIDSWQRKQSLQASQCPVNARHKLLYQAEPASIQVPASSAWPRCTNIAI